MMMRPTYSNGRHLSLKELDLILLATTFPESDLEPKELSNFRRECEASFKAAQEVPGSILDSLQYVYLKKTGMLHE